MVLVDETPDHSVFGRARSRIGTNKLAKIFSLLRDQLKAQGYMSEVFTFVDATHLIAKANLWIERDKTIEHIVIQRIFVFIFHMPFQSSTCKKCGLHLN